MPMMAESPVAVSIDTRFIESVRRFQRPGPASPPRSNTLVRVLEPTSTTSATGPVSTSSHTVSGTDDVDGLVVVSLVPTIEVSTMAGSARYWETRPASVSWPFQIAPASMLATVARPPKKPRS